MTEFATEKPAADLLPMEARLVKDLPAKPGLQVQPKRRRSRPLYLSIPRLQQSRETRAELGLQAL